MWSAHGACHGLRMKTSICWILIFSFAIGTHRKRCHRGLWAVIGNVFDNSETWPTVGAVDERVSVAPIVRVEYLTQAIRADGNIRGDWLEGAFYRLRGENFQGVKSVCGLERSREFVNARKRRSFVA